MSNLIWYPGFELLIKDIVRAENCSLYSADNTKYIDLESGIWCTSIGHGHPSIRRVIAEQSAKISHTGYCYSSEIVEQAAQEILGLLGFEHGKCVFLCSGSEAVEYGVRVARSVLDPPLLLSMTDSYFGAYGSARDKKEDEWFAFDWSQCVDCGEDCEHWASIPFGRIGGFLFEPGSSSGFVRFPPKRLIQRIVARIKENDGLILVNEVTTGVGRTGAWFGYQHYGITPDIIAIGKGIGNGYPVSVAAFSSDVMDHLGNRPIKYAQSHQNDALGAAVAREVVRTIREGDLIERGRDIATALIAGLKSIKARTGKIEEIRARGLMVAVELKDDSQATLTTQTHKALVHRGYILAQRPGFNVLRLDPSLTIEMPDIEGFLETFEHVLFTA